MTTHGVARALCFALSVTTTALFVSPAFAQAPSAEVKEQAKKLKAEADKAMDDIQYADALKKYSAAFELTHDPALIYNRARAYGALNQYPAAVAELERFAREAPPELKAKVPGLDQLLADFKNHTSQVTITCNVTANVLVRDISVGTCPMNAPLVVNAGPASITVSAVDYITLKKDVVLEGSKSQTVDFSLEKQNPTTILVLHSTPDSATTSVDDKPAGVTPIDIPLTPGTHRLLLTHSGYKDLTTQVGIERGERKTLDLKLDPSGVTSKWWFWTTVVLGVAVVAGGVVGLVYALTTEKSPDSGTIAPGQIKTPLTF
jgi:PEGA domain